MKFLKKNKWLILTLILVFVFTLPFPFSGDDIQWGFGSISIKRILDFAKNASLNGRYMGNIFVIIMTKNIFIRGLFMAIILTAIVYIIKKETKTSSLITWLLLLLMPMKIFQQTVVWTSGFTNYVISTLALLLSLLLIRKAYNNENKKWYLYLLNFLTLFVSSLFIENLTIFLLIFTILLAIINMISKKKFNLSLLFCFLGSAIGTITMFIHPAYHKVVDGTDGYRTYANGIEKLIDLFQNNYINTIHKYISFENIFLIIFITLILFIIYKKKKKDYSKKQNIILGLILSFLYLYILYAIIYLTHPNWSPLLKYTTMFNAYITILFVISLILITILMFYKSKNFIKIIMPLVVITGLVAPLFIVSPIGPRNFFMIYVLEIIYALYLLKEADIKIEKYNHLIILPIIVIIGYYTSIYGYINMVNTKRDNYILDKSNNTSCEIVYVPRIPYSEYVWTGDFESEYRANIYKAVHNIRGNIQFVFLDYNEWYDYIQNENK